MVKLLITRPGEAGLSLQQMLQMQGIACIYFPTIEIEAIRKPTDLISFSKATQVIFISPNAVRFGAHYLAAEQSVLAVGAGTAKALQLAGWQVTASPEQFSSEGLLSLACLQQVKGQTIAIVKGIGGRELLCQALEKRGAQVVELAVYRRLQPKGQASEAVLQEVDTVLASSIESAQNLVLMTPEEQRLALFNKRWLVTSPRIAQFVEEEFKVARLILAADARNETLVRLLESLAKSP